MLKQPLCCCNVC